MENGRVRRLIVGITGATGTIFGVRILQVLQIKITDKRVSFK